MKKMIGFFIVLFSIYAVNAQSQIDIEQKTNDGTNVYHITLDVQGVISCIEFVSVGGEKQQIMTVVSSGSDYLSVYDTKDIKLVQKFKVAGSNRYSIEYTRLLKGSGESTAATMDLLYNDHEVRTIQNKKTLISFNRDKKYIANDSQTLISRSGSFIKNTINGSTMSLTRSKNLYLIVENRDPNIVTPTEWNVSSTLLSKSAKVDAINFRLLPGELWFLLLL